MSDNIVSIRGHTHGEFRSNAKASQARKADWRLHPGWLRMNEQQREAFDLIATKMGRILAGDPFHEDHWVDLAGYAELGRRACEDGSDYEPIVG